MESAAYFRPLPSECHCCGNIWVWWSWRSLPSVFHGLPSFMVWIHHTKDLQPGRQWNSREIRRSHRWWTNPSSNDDITPHKVPSQSQLQHVKYVRNNDELWSSRLNGGCLLFNQCHIDRKRFMKDFCSAQIPLLKSDGVRPNPPPKKKKKFH